jgi:hypothetical protein
VIKQNHAVKSLKKGENKTNKKKMGTMVADQVAYKTAKPLKKGGKKNLKKSPVLKQNCRQS